MSKGAEEIRLPELLVALRPGAMLAGAVDGREEARPVEREKRRPGFLSQRRLHRLDARDQRIARARLHERLEHTFVGQAHVEYFAERVERGDPPAKLFAGCEDRLNRPFAEPLDRREPVADGV